MKPERWQQLDDLFHSALEHISVFKEQSHISQMCDCPNHACYHFPLGLNESKAFYYTGRH